MSSIPQNQDIEVFFKSCKSCLRLVKECRSLSYDALNAHTAIVFTRYMMLSVAKWRDEDDKSGNLLREGKRDPGHPGQE